VQNYKVNSQYCQKPKKKKKKNYKKRKTTKNKQKKVAHVLEELLKWQSTCLANAKP
jgi:2,3-bisphosphoglycerate-independent phosphoglycerate mutase